MKSLRVLIADDDGLTLLMLRNILTKLGHTVVGEAIDGKQAVKIARCANPDLLILDIRMPVMDGFEASRRIRGQRPVPTIILSCHSESGLGRRAAAAGANAYLVKPFTMAQFNPVIELALADFRRRTELEDQLKLMNEKLETRKAVERAKGILMRQTGLDEESAYSQLQETAHSKNLTDAEMARAVIAAEQVHRAAATRALSPRP